MNTAGTWYPPAAGTGGFLVFSNPPFAMAAISNLLDWALDHRSEHQNTLLMDLLDLARMWERAQIGPDKRIEIKVFEAHWGVSRVAARSRLRNLKRAGLVSYESGSGVVVGYRFQRVGPPWQEMAG